MARAVGKTDDPVFKALADVTRRELLDLLRDGPRTTGQLCERFDLSRFAVMKHLGVLEEAGLVVVRRAGRERWNHLNAVPIRQIYERWVSGFAAHWAASLVQIKGMAEILAAGAGAAKTRGLGAVTAVEPGMGSGRITGGLIVGDAKPGGIPNESFSLEQEVLIQAPRVRVFTALTQDVQQWWAHRFQDGGSIVRLEPRLGGLFYEDFGNGEGALWGTVTYIKRPEILRLTGPLGMNSAVSSTYTYTLEEQGEATLLRLSHQAAGFIEPQWKEGYSKGWSGLLSVCLKCWVEQGKPFTACPENGPPCAKDA